MARTATATKPKGTTNPETDGPAVHHMARGLSALEGEQRFTADQLDDHCQTWLDQGYRLLSVHPTYITPEQGPGGMIVTNAEWHILYIFVRD